MANEIRFDPAMTAFLTMDLQNGIFGFAPGAETVLPTARQVTEAARQSGLRIIHIGIGFEEGYPEVSPDNSRFSALKQSKRFVKGSDSAEFAEGIRKAGELVVYKHRVSAFSQNNLEMILRAQGIKTLILTGISTSGVVLSTLRRAADLDFQCFVIEDACYDKDPEVHRVLTQKIFPAQATVLSSREFIAALKN